MQEEPWYNPIVVFLSGMSVPLGSAQRMYDEVQVPHEEVVRGLEAFQNEIVAVANGTSSGASGAWPQEYVRAMGTFASGDGADYVQGLKDAAGQLADGAHEFGYQIDYTNAMIVGQVVVFLAEWALTLVLAYFNPIQALVEQLALERVFGQFFKMALVRFAINAGLIMSVSVGLAAALDGLVRWVLALKGETTTQGAQYRRQSLEFGAVQGAFGAFLPFLMEPVAKLVSKAFGPAVSNAIRDAVDAAVTDPGKELAGAAGKDFEGGAVRAADEKPAPPPLSVFSRHFADEAAQMAGALHAGVVDLEARRAFATGMGKLFAQTFGEAGRAAGQDWALAFAKNLGRPALQKALYNSLEKLPAETAGEPLRTALSRGVVRGLDTQAWKTKFAHIPAEAPLNAAHQNISEGFFNWLTTGQFTTSFATGISGAGGGIISAVMHLHAVHLANWLKPDSLGTPPHLDTNPTDINPTDINPTDINPTDFDKGTPTSTTSTSGAGTGPFAGAGPHQPRPGNTEKRSDSTETPLNPQPQARGTGQEPGMTPWTTERLHTTSRELDDSPVATSPAAAAGPSPAGNTLPTASSGPHTTTPAAPANTQPPQTTPGRTPAPAPDPTGNQGALPPTPKTFTDPSAVRTAPAAPPAAAIVPTNETAHVQANGHESGTHVSGEGLSHSAGSSQESPLATPAGDDDGPAAGTAPRDPDSAPVPPRPRVRESVQGQTPRDTTQDTPPTPAPRQPATLEGPTDDHPTGTHPAPPSPDPQAAEAARQRYVDAQQAMATAQREYDAARVEADGQKASSTSTGPTRLHQAEEPHRSAGKELDTAARLFPMPTDQLAAIREACQSLLTDDHRNDLAKAGTYLDPDNSDHHAAYAWAHDQVNDHNAVPLKPGPEQDRRLTLINAFTPLIAHTYLTHSDRDRAAIKLAHDLAHTYRTRRTTGIGARGDRPTWQPLRPTTGNRHSPTPADSLFGSPSPSRHTTPHHGLALPGRRPPTPADNLSGRTATPGPNRHNAPHPDQDWLNPDHKGKGRDTQVPQVPAGMSPALAAPRPSTDRRGMPPLLGLPGAGKGPQLVISPEAVTAVQHAWDKARGSNKRFVIEINDSSITLSRLVDHLFEEIGASEYRESVTAGNNAYAVGNHKLLFTYHQNGQPRSLRIEVTLKNSQTITALLAVAGPGKDAGPHPGATGPAVSTRAKFEVGSWFSDLMKLRVEQPVMLAGGAQITLKYGSPRPVADLDFRAEIDNVAPLAQRINDFVRHEHPRAELVPFKPDEKDKRALTGWIDGVEITIGPSHTHYTDLEVINGITVASHTDALVDKAFSFAVRTGPKKGKDLFDLLWALHDDPAGTVVLRGQLDELRNAAFQKKHPGQLLSTEFTLALADAAKTSGAIKQLQTQWVKQFGVSEADVAKLTATLDDLKGAFHAGAGPHRAMLVTVGNFTGDMFGTASALVLNPKLHVAVLTGPKYPDQVGGFLRETLTTRAQAQYDKELAKLQQKQGLSKPDLHAKQTQLWDQFKANLAADLARVHLVKTDNPHALYADITKKGRLLPFAKAQPSVPENLKSVHLQRPVAHGTTEVTTRWDGQGGARRKIRAAWGLGDGPDTRAKGFLKDQGVRISDKYVVLWSRFSGKKGGTHPQHDTSFTGMKQIIDALPDDVTVLIAGDKPLGGTDHYRQWAKRDNVFDLTEFWKSDAWRRHFPNATRADQFKVFDSLVQQGGSLKHLGFRSGNLEPYALIGHDVRYLEEAGNMQARRMEPWHGTVGYERITVSKVPTLTGQWVTRHVDNERKERSIAWHGTDDAASKNLKAQELNRQRLSPANRGFAHGDLAAIGKYLGFTLPEPPHAAGGAVHSAGSRPLPPGKSGAAVSIDTRRPTPGTGHSIPAPLGSMGAGTHVPQGPRVSAGMSPALAVDRFVDDPRVFMDRVLLSVDFLDGITARTPSVSLQQADYFVKHLMPRFDRHWFTLVVDSRRQGGYRGRDAFYLTPALEQYARYADTNPGRVPQEAHQFFNGVRRALPPVNTASYILAGYVQYKTGRPVDVQQDVGHALVRRNRDTGSFNPDFVFTDTMNGCAFAVTGVTSETFTISHFQSPASNSKAASSFRRAYRPVDWFGDNEYMTKTPAGLSEGVNFLWRDPAGDWQFISQENVVSHRSMADVLQTKVSARPLVVAPGSEGRNTARIYHSMAEFHLGRLLNDLGQIKTSQEPDWQAERAAWESFKSLLRIRMQFEVEQLADIDNSAHRMSSAENFRLLAAAARNFTREREGLTDMARHFIITAEKHGLAAARSGRSFTGPTTKDPANDVHRRVNNAKEILQRFEGTWSAWIQDLQHETASRPLKADTTGTVSRPAPPNLYSSRTSSPHPPPTEASSTHPGIQIRAAEKQPTSADTSPASRIFQALTERFAGPDTVTHRAAANVARGSRLLGGLPAGSGVRVVSADAGGVLPGKYAGLDRVNPYREQGRGFATNCVLAAIAVDMWLKDPDGAVHQAPPSELGALGRPEGEVAGLRNHLANYLNRDADPVDGPAAVIEAMSQAPLGARGMVVIENDNSEIAHVINVVHDETGVLFLDGQAGTLAPTPTSATAFLPTTHNIPGHPLVRDTSIGEPAGQDIPLGSGIASRLHEHRQTGGAGGSHEGPGRTQRGAARAVPQPGRWQWLLEGQDPVRYVLDAGPNTVHVHALSLSGGQVSDYTREELRRIASTVLDFNAHGIMYGYERPVMTVRAYSLSPVRVRQHVEDDVRGPAVRVRDALRDALGEVLSSRGDRGAHDGRFSIEVAHEPATWSGVEIEVVYWPQATPGPDPRQVRPALDASQPPHDSPVVGRPQARSDRPGRSGQDVSQGHAASGAPGPRRDRPSSTQAVPGPASRRSAGPGPRQTEEQRWQDRILEDFGVGVDSAAGVEAVLLRDPTAPDGEKRKVSAMPWDTRTLSQVHAALKHYEPILQSHIGPEGQGRVTAVAFVTTSLRNGTADPRPTGELIGTILTLYRAGTEVYEGSDRSVPRPNSVEWSATRALADLLPRASYEEFRGRFWHGIEPPASKPNGLPATHPTSDLFESIRHFLLDAPAFYASHPRHAQAMAALRTSHTHLFARRPNGVTSHAYANLTDDLVSWFTAQVGTWTDEGARAFPYSERPITARGEASAADDFRDTAMYHYIDKNHLQHHAPRRAAHFANLMIPAGTDAAGSRGPRPAAGNPGLRS